MSGHCSMLALQSMTSGSYYVSRLCVLTNPGCIDISVTKLLNLTCITRKVDGMSWYALVPVSRAQGLKTFKPFPLYLVGTTNLAQIAAIRHCYQDCCFAQISNDQYLSLEYAMVLILVDLA